MTITVEQAVALAEEHMDSMTKRGTEIRYIEFTVEGLTAMLNDHDYLYRKAPTLAQEPVAWMSKDEWGHTVVQCAKGPLDVAVPLYTTPQPTALLLAFHGGMDVHRATAAEVFGVPTSAVSSEQRRYAKVINFGLIYGMSAFGLAKSLGIDNTAAKNYIERYFDRYPGVKRYMDGTRQQAKAKGYVETVFGRRLYLPEINSPNGPRRSGAERAAINAPMQGTAADLIKMSMNEVRRVLDTEGRKTKMIMQVHDELVFEVPEAEVDWLRREVPRIMAGVARLKVPLLAEVGVGPNWEQAH
jgi:DNA polymerase-1